ncbi:PilZ domain-containing protein [Sphingomonas sp.]|uniref:PilZ domain-containing protein n=1 Tax=Sphingomonas sp. TaxID=28214 RepID=UPI0025FA4155|nr:PilZ domain-containing protein [Sphingomonas sp.]
MVSNVQRLEAPLIDPINRRSSPRVSVLVAQASVRKFSEQPTEAVLGDLSIYGCRIQSPLEHSANERVWLRFSGTNPIHATVVWSDKGFVGCRFDVPIANSLFRSLTLDGTPQLKIAEITR